MATLTTVVSAGLLSSSRDRDLATGEGFVKCCRWRSAKHQQASGHVIGGRLCRGDLVACATESGVRIYDMVRESFVAKINMFSRSSPCLHIFSRMYPPPGVAFSHKYAPACLVLCCLVLLRVHCLSVPLHSPSEQFPLCECSGVKT